MKTGPSFPDPFYLLLAAVVILYSQRSWSEEHRISLWVRKCLCCKTARWLCQHPPLSSYSQIIQLFPWNKRTKCSSALGVHRNYSKHYEHTHGWVQSTVPGPLQTLPVPINMEIQNSSNSALPGIFTVCLSYLWRPKPVILPRQISFKFCSNLAQLITINQLFSNRINSFSAYKLSQNRLRYLCAH